MPDYNIDPYFSTNAGPPNMAAQLFGMISSLPDAYQQGVKQKFERGQMARTEEQQKPYTGRLDPMEIMHESMRRGGIEDAQKYVGPLLEMMGNRQINEGLGGGGPSEPSYGPQNPRTSPDAQTPGGLRGETSQPGQSAGPAGENPAHQNIRQLAINAGIDPQSDAFRQAFAGTNIDRDFTSPLQAAGAARRIQMLSQGDAGPGQAAPTAALGPGGGQGTMYMPGPGMQGAPPAPPMQIAQATPPNAPASTPVGTEAQAKFYEDRGNKRLAVSTAPFAKPKVAEAAQKAAEADFARAKDIRDTLASYAKPTTAQQEAPPGMSVPQAKAYTKSLEDLAAAKGKAVAARVEGIKPAREALQVVDEMDNALTSGWNNISTGPGARQFLEVKKAVNNVFPGTFAHVSESETIDKLNAQLAAAAAKAMTARPSQLEFKAFMANNPGLLTSRETSKGLLDLMRQAKQQDVQLGQLADKFMPGEGKNWSDIEEQYYRGHPIISPFTHKPVDAKQAPDGKWYRPDPDRPGKYLAER